MAILAECPICHKKQCNKNKVCPCGEDLTKAKRSQRVKYWITYRLPGGKQRRELVGSSVEAARAAEGKRKGQKKENRIFDMLPQARMTFRELSDWYLNLKHVKKLASYVRMNLGIENFNKVFGEYMVNSIRPMDLENFQEIRAEQGKSPATIDMELSLVKTMITKAFDNDMVDGRVLKAFRSIKKRLRKGSNARRRVVSIGEYLKLLKVSPPHLRAMLITAFNSGARLGEIRNLRWAYIDYKSMMIRLPAKETKEGKSKSIPINHHVKAVLDSLPRALHHDFVFTYKNKPIKGEQGVRKALDTACIQAGIAYGRKEDNGITFHDIRRTVKTYMVDAGIDKVHRDLILGHSLQGMDMHYIAPSEESLKVAMGRYTSWINEQMKLKNVDHNVDQMLTRSERL